ncbi:MAG: aldehyde dehydrogenase family protein, partial [Acidobacteriaceae bacterium]|nr:aldehyde dehydrogenase family protein [Acidobacteriaceae bacterium]
MATSTLVGISTIHHWIGGASVETGSGRTGIVWNPATGEQHAQVNFASVAEVDAAVAAAKAAFPAWRATSLSRRAEVMFRFRALLEENRAKLAAVISTENGKTLADAAGEVARGMENVEFACGVPHMLKGGYSEQVSS